MGNCSINSDLTIPTKYYMHNPETVLENEMKNSSGILRFKNIPNLGQTTGPNNNQHKKKTCRIVDVAVPADHRVKLKEKEKKDKCMVIARKLKNVEHKSDGYTNCNWGCWYIHQRIGSRTEGFGNKGTSGDHLNYSIVEIGQNTEKIPGDLRWLFVLKRQWKKHQLTLIWKLWRS